MSEDFTQDEDVPVQSTTPDTLIRGSAFGRYVILDRLGVGGMGVVYAAFDPELDRKVAIKVLREGGSAVSIEGRALLQREAQTMARVSHTNVVSVFDTGSVGERMFIAMELVSGGTLRQWIAETPRSWREILKNYLAAGRGLAAAHAAGLVHRDFKPDNILIGKDGRIQVTDFGLAHAVDAVAGSTKGPAAGTPAYMAPEQLAGKPPDARSDEYGFCVALYEALYGDRPSRAGDPEARGLLTRPAKAVGLPPHLYRALTRGLSVEPADRFPTVTELLDELARDPSARLRRRLQIGIAAVCLGATGVSVWVFEHHRHDHLCSGAADEVAAVWGSEQRTAIARAFHATGKSYAGQTLDNVVGVFDSYARGWADMRTGACEARRVRGEQTEQVLSLRMACLDRCLDDFQALAQLFATADAAVVQRASMAVRALAPLKACADVEGLEAPIPLPTDPEARERIRELGKSLAHAKSLNAGGKYAEGIVLARTLVATAERLDYLPARAEALALRGRLELRTGDFKAAEASLMEAVWDGEAGRADKYKIEASGALGYLLADQLGRYAEGHEWNRLREATVRRIGGDPLQLALTLSDRAVFFMDEGRLGEAAETFDAALGLLRPLPRHVPGTPINITGPEFAEGIILSNYAEVFRFRGDFDRAYKTYQRASELIGSVLGPDHPETLMPTFNLGLAQGAAGQLDAALQNVRRATDSWEQSLGPEHPRMMDARAGLSAVLLDRGDVTGAISEAEHALRIGRKAFGAKSAQSAESMLALARALDAAGKLAESLAESQEALAILLATPDANQPTLANALDAVGKEQLRQGHSDAALELLERALVLRQHLQRDPAEVQRTAFALAQVVWNIGKDRERAVKLARAAVIVFTPRVDCAVDLEHATAWLRAHG